LQRKNGGRLPKAAKEKANISTCVLDVEGFLEGLGVSGKDPVELTKAGRDHRDVQPTNPGVVGATSEVPRIAGTGNPWLPQGFGDGGFLRLTQIVGDRSATPPIPAVIPVGKTTIWMWVKAGKFPKPIKLGPGVTAWSGAEVRAWMAARQKLLGLD
jgi:predicted DNA-binding transcriptional regulator AlpA